MIKAFRAIRHDFMCNFQSYRKKQGGMWFKICEYAVSGFASPAEYWVQELPNRDDYTIILTEDYRLPDTGKTQE